MVEVYVGGATEDLLIPKMVTKIRNRATNEAFM